MTKTVNQSSQDSQIRRIEIEDVFGPSFAEIGAPDVEELKSPRTRMVLHNWHIKSKVLPNSLNAAHLLGCPPVLPRLSLAATQESEEFLTYALGEAGSISEIYEETSVEWLCLKIYSHYVHVAKVLKQVDPPLAQLSDYMIILGATCRELELAIMHKKTVEDRKKTNDRLAGNNEGRKAVNEARKQLKHLRIAHAQAILNTISTPNLNNSSLARIVYERWFDTSENQNTPPRPSKRTIENYFSQKKLSRTHPST